MSRKIKILYIDDEIPSLLGFKASFRSIFETFIAHNATEAIDVLNNNTDIEVILCDQRMPDMTGVELLEEIRVSHPFPIRILITGYSNAEAIIDAINRGHIFRYIKKPWMENDVLSAITEAHHYYLTSSMLAKKNEELTKAYRELDKFAYSVSHDLKGPISSIAGAILLLEDETDLNEIRSMHRMIRESVEKMDQFITSIHDYYKIQRGELKIEIIDFIDLINDLKGIYNITQKIQKTNFEIILNEELEFRSDLVSIKLILNNLLSNAFKYQREDNPDKFVRLTINIKREYAEFIVKDNGIGIKDDYINNIFTIFYRATSEKHGSGFGLYNVKDVLQKLSGEIKVNSTLGEGSEFIVRIPVKNLK